jgi:hypothetical protein
MPAAQGRRLRPPSVRVHHGPNHAPVPRCRQCSDPHQHDVHDRLLTLAGAPLPEYKSLLRWTQGAAKRGLIKRNTGPMVLPPRPGGAPPAGTTTGPPSAGVTPSGGGGAGAPSGGTAAPPASCKVMIGSICVVP